MREAFQDQNGFTFTRTELAQIMIGREACPEAIAAADLDGDGWGDLVAIDSPGYDFSSLTLVALHGPTGRIVWRAHEGATGKRLVISDGVVVAEGQNGASLIGVDARSGNVLWSTRLPGRLREDPYGPHGTWNTPALTDCGSFVAFACDDGCAYAVESKTGRVAVTKHHACLAEYNHGLRNVVVFLIVDDRGKNVEVWDLERNGLIVGGGVHACSPLALSPEGNVYWFHADQLPNGVPVTRVAVFEAASKRPLRTVYVTPGKGNVLPHNGASTNWHRMAAIGNDRLILASDDEERGGGIVIDLNAPQKPGVKPSVNPVSRMPPPQRGYGLRLVERFAQTVALVWEHESSHKIMVIGYDLATLEPRWFVGGAGGADLKNQTLRTDTALLVPFSLSGREENKPGAINYWAHIDPTTGAELARYTVSELDTVRLFGKYFLGHASSFPGAPPVLWDTERRERLL